MHQTRSRQTRYRGAVGASALALAAALTCSLAQAEQTDKEYVVTATRTRTPAGQIGSSYTVVTRQDIERRQFRSVVEVLRSIRGLHITQSGGRGKAASIFSRGTESNHTLFLINGIRVSDPSNPGGTFQFEHLNLDDVERIEVVRGPQSVLFGSEAIGAVVNIITKRGGKGITVTGQAEGGSFRTSEARIGVDATYKWLDANISYSRLDTVGFSTRPERLGGFEEDGSWNWNLSGRLGLRPVDWLDIDLYAKTIQSKTDIDPFVDDLNSVSKTQGRFARIAFTFKLFEGKLRSRAAFSYAGHRRSTTNPPDVKNPFTNTASFFKSDKPRFSFQNELNFIPHNKITIGGHVEWESASSGGSSFFSFRQTFVNRAIFVQDQISLFDRLFVTVGFRVDRLDGFDTAVTWRVAPAYVIKETGTTIKGSVGTGFKAPTVSERFGFNPGFPAFSIPAFFGNPNLKPERSRGFDVGFEQRLFDGRLLFGVTYFQNDIRNLITTNSAFTTNINIGRAKTWGFEAFVKAQLHKTVDLSIAYTYLRAEDTTIGQELVRRPRHLVNADITWRPTKKATINLGVRMIGTRADFQAVSPFGRTQLPGEATVRLAAAYKVNQYLTVFGRVENLFDSSFEEPNGFQSPRIAAFAGIKLSLNVLNP